MDEWAGEFLAEVAEGFRQQRVFAERAVAQLDDADLMRAAGAEDNSVAALMKHMGGNLRSRWTEPFTTDGEKPDRDRDGEFDLAADTPESVRAVWERGWSVLEATLAAMTPADLGRPVTIRGEQLTLMRALLRSLNHAAQHTGQVVMLAKQWKGSEWKTLSIPRGESAKYLTSPPRH
ncbi:MAG TPA: DUF1572 family protein [Longimicrobiales bacterium]|nr:DUF1572 family protein [Longimicrobiales bacterium]